MIIGRSITGFLKVKNNKMKKISTVLLGIIIIIAIVSCAGADTPEKVAKKFLTHMAKEEYSDAKKLATGDALEMIKTLESFASLVDDDIEVDTPKIENMNCETKEKTSTCTYIQNGVEQSIDLEKVEEKWLVSQFPKEGSSSEEEIE